MTHDQLCPLTSCVGPVCTSNDCTCACTLINKVRDDERSNNFTPDDHSDSTTQAYFRGYNNAKADIEQTRHVHPLLDENKRWERFSQDQFDAGYADAIYTAIRKVEDLPVMTIGSYVGITEAQVLSALRALHNNRRDYP